MANASKLRISKHYTELLGQFRGMFSDHGEVVVSPEVKQIWQNYGFLLADQHRRLAVETAIDARDTFKKAYREPYLVTQPLLDLYHLGLSYPTAHVFLE